MTPDSFYASPFHASRKLDTPVGPLWLTASEDGLTHVGAGRVQRNAMSVSAATDAARHHLDDASRALDEYFAGRRSSFDDLTLAACGSDFQRRVWSALERIPFGAMRSYGEIARQIGRPGAARAVGLANGRNPIAIVLPCHRVVGANGQLVGYAGGLEMKQWLLAHEGAIQPRRVPSSSCSTKAPPTHEPTGIAT